VFRGYLGVFRVYFVLEMAQVELKRGRVYNPAWRLLDSLQMAEAVWAGAYTHSHFRST